MRRFNTPRAPPRVICAHRAPGWRLKLASCVAGHFRPPCRWIAPPDVLTSLARRGRLLRLLANAPTEPRTGRRPQSWHYESTCAGTLVETPNSRARSRPATTTTAEPWCQRQQAGAKAVGAQADQGRMPAGEPLEAARVAALNEGSAHLGTLRAASDGWEAPTACASETGNFGRQSAITVPPGGSSCAAPTRHLAASPPRRPAAPLPRRPSGWMRSPGPVSSDSRSSRDFHRALGARVAVPVAGGEPKKATRFGLDASSPQSRSKASSAGRSSRGVLCVMVDSCGPRHVQTSGGRRAWRKDEAKAFKAVWPAVGRASPTVAAGTEAPASSCPAPPSTFPRVPCAHQGPGTWRWPPDGAVSCLGPALWPSLSTGDGIRTGCAAVTERTEDQHPPPLVLPRPSRGSPALTKVPGRGAGHMVGVRGASSARGTPKLAPATTCRHHLSRLLCNF